MRMADQVEMKQVGRQTMGRWADRPEQNNEQGQVRRGQIWSLGGRSIAGA
jgi:hypothetical protein